MNIKEENDEQKKKKKAAGGTMSWGSAAGAQRTDDDTVTEQGIMAILCDDNKPLGSDDIFTRMLVTFRCTHAFNKIGINELVDQYCTTSYGFGDANTDELSNAFYPVLKMTKTDDLPVDFLEELVVQLEVNDLSTEIKAPDFKEKVFGICRTTVLPYAVQIQFEKAMKQKNVACGDVSFTGMATWIQEQQEDNNPEISLDAVLQLIRTARQEEGVEVTPDSSPVVLSDQQKEYISEYYRFVLTYLADLKRKQDEKKTCQYFR